MNWKCQHDHDVLSELRHHFPDSSSTKLRKMLTEGRVQVNGEITHRAKHNLNVGDTITLLGRAEANTISPPPKKFQYQPKMNIMFEDDTLLVVEKPPSLLTIATDKLERETLHAYCVEYLQETSSLSWCHIVHRLDKDTSGIIVFSKSERAKKDLQEQFAKREVHRQYIALVEGKPELMHGTVETYLVEDKHLNVKATNRNDPKGKQAITHYAVADSNEHATLVDVTIETGRRHQIRMAMQYLGHPVCGDEAHGSTLDPFGRICLHATALEFIHPQTDDPVRFESPFPKDWAL